MRSISATWLPCLQCYIQNLENLIIRCGIDNKVKVAEFWNATFHISALATNILVFQPPPPRYDSIGSKTLNLRKKAGVKFNDLFL